MTDSPEEPRELGHKTHEATTSSPLFSTLDLGDLPAAGSSVGLRAFLLLGLLVELGQDEAVPALDQTAQFGLARLLVRVGEDQAQRRGFGDGPERSQEVAGLCVELTGRVRSAADSGRVRRRVGFRT